MGNLPSGIRKKRSLIQIIPDQNSLFWQTVIPLCRLFVHKAFHKITDSMMVPSCLILALNFSPTQLQSYRILLVQMYFIFSFLLLSFPQLNFCIILWKAGKHGFILSLHFVVGFCLKSLKFKQRTLKSFLSVNNHYT